MTNLLTKRTALAATLAALMIAGTTASADAGSKGVPTKVKRAKNRIFNKMKRNNKHGLNATVVLKLTTVQYYWRRGFNGSRQLIRRTTVRTHRVQGVRAASEIVYQFLNNGTPGQKYWRYWKYPAGT